KQAMEGARLLLVDALNEYRRARSDAEFRQALLSMHTAVQDAFVAYLAQEADMVVDERAVHFPDLVDLVRDHTDLFGGDTHLPGVLVSLNSLRARVAHPKNKPTSEEVKRDTAKFDQLIRRFWPKWFGEPCAEPRRGTSAPGAQRAAQPKRLERVQPFSPSQWSSRDAPQRQKPAPSRRPEPPRVTPPPPSPEPKRPVRASAFLRKLWTDPQHPKLQWGLVFRRLFGIGLLLLLAYGCKEGALYTARWPQPVKVVGLGLMLFAAVFLVWGIVLIAKLLWQLRLKRLLILGCIGWALVLAASFLTLESERPLHEQLWLAARTSVGWIGRAAIAAPTSIAQDVSEFRTHFNGRLSGREWARLADAEPDYLTPIPADPALVSGQATPTRQAETTLPTPTTQPSEGGISPTPSPALQPTRPSATPTLVPPACPHPQAQFVEPRQNQVIQNEVQVVGSANIENLGYYKFEFQRQDIEDEWHWVESFETPVEEGVLGMWHVSHLPDGLYTFRLTVVNVQGNYPFPPCDVNVTIRH
ncbi:MAG: hypothetical protein AB8I80_23225, partial [Anaerolineae bacterium]